MDTMIHMVRTSLDNLVLLAMVMIIGLNNSIMMAHMALTDMLLNFHQVAVNLSVATKWHPILFLKTKITMALQMG